MENSNVKISSKIVSVKLGTAAANEPVVQSIAMNEFIEREAILIGRTFKLKPANSKHALYITLNAQCIDGILYPREIFFNTKNPEHKMWMDAMALTLSAVFRKGNDVSFIVEEFKAVYDTEGYWGKSHETGKGKYYKSIVEEIGCVIGIFLNTLQSGASSIVPINSKKVKGTVIEPNMFPDHAQVCKSCSTKAVVILDGCNTCLNCGDSKCS
jgi:hypothetical protein